MKKNYYEPNNRINMKLSLRRTLVRLVLHAAKPHPLSPSPVGEGAVLRFFSKLFVLPYQLYNTIEHAENKC